MKSALLFFGLCVFLLIGSGCGGVGIFDYSSPGSGSMIRFAEGARYQSVAVMPFLDRRPNGDSGSPWLGMIPLVPFTYVTKQQPENSESFQTLHTFKADPATDLADAAYQSLRASGLFAKVVMANRSVPPDTDYIFQGTVTNLRYEAGYFTYCVTYFLAPSLWLLGAPTGYSGNDLGVDFTLTDRKSGKLIWRYSFSGHDYINHWLYARIGADVDLYPKLMKLAMNQALKDLEAKK